MFKKILIVIALIAAATALFIVLQPNEFRISRSSVISAPAAAIFVHVNDFHKWGKWSPWVDLDPDMKKTYEGSQSGVGAVHTWMGNNQVGEGGMAITESLLNERIRIKLEFLKPFKASNEVEFIFKSQGADTTVTWTMSGKNNFISKAMSLIMNCDKMVGGQFEKGLSKLKGIVEDEA